MNWVLYRCPRPAPSFCFEVISERYERGLRIVNRPEEIEARLVPGHWEGDLIKGPVNRSSVGTLVERKTRFMVLCRLRGNGAEAILDSFTRQMKRLPAALRKSMTYDRGSEMACHQSWRGG